ncbi:MAG: AAA family ATPase, partial [Bacteroidota bacterium]|nr:AAA family ATPase [Bacteroidota bacterium]
KLNLGYSDFKGMMINNNYFVDKSLLIEDVIKVQKAVLLFPRPRRFGKTLNLSMLKYFFDKNESENEKLFANLKIWKTGNDIIKHCGKYPVIFLTFKDAKANTWNDTLKFIKIEIAKAYDEHYYLFESDILRKHEKDAFTEIVTGKGDDVDFAVSLKRLSKYLHKYHNKKVVILIDEYDSPIQAGYKKFYDDIIPFMQNLLSGAFKDNSNIYKGVITGILRVSKENIFSGLNNVSVYTILDNRFSDKFGFTEPETKQVINDFKIKTEYSQIKKWYDGYQFGKTKNIYNPWSILNYVSESEGGFKAFWTHSSSNSLIKERIFERDYDYIKNNFEKLLQGKYIIKNIEEEIIFPDLEKKTKELLWSLLLFTGYLTAEPVPEQAKTHVKLNHYNLSIPNFEVKKLFREIITEWLTENLQISSTLLFNAANNLVNNNLKEFEKELQSIMGDTFSYFDTAKTKGQPDQNEITKSVQLPENVFHSYMLGLLAILGENYIIRSNRESGEGRYDILVRPFDITKNGIIIEIKSIEKRQKNEEAQDFHMRINNAITEAENQIETNDYDKELIDNRITNIIKLPIVFAGKVPFIFLLNTK